MGDAEVPPSVYMELLPIERSEYGCLTNDIGEPQHYVNADIHKPREKKLWKCRQSNQIHVLEVQIAQANAGDKANAVRERKD